MSDLPPFDPSSFGGPQDEQQPDPDPNRQSDFGRRGEPLESVSHSPVAARVPEKVVRGVFSTGQVVLDGPREFVIDFLQAITRPHQLVARVILPPQTMSEFIDAYERNIALYTQRFGPPAQPPPTPPLQNRPSARELYDNLKITDDQYAGAYANTVMVGHGPTEFFFDFITGFFPVSCVSARVFLPAQQATRFLTTLRNVHQQRQNRLARQTPPQPPSDPQPPTPPPDVF